MGESIRSKRVCTKAVYKQEPEVVAGLLVIGWGTLVLLSNSRGHLPIIDIVCMRPIQFVHVAMALATYCTTSSNSVETAHCSHSAVVRVHIFNVIYASSCFNYTLVSSKILPV